ncbi:MAG: hypothetical protein ABI573_09750 [Chloroflexota bacterium]
MTGRQKVSASLECRRHASALLDLVDAHAPSRESGAAMDHLEWCRACAEEFQDLALAIVAMRRFGAFGADESGSPYAWPRLRARIEGTRAAAAAVAWRWRASVAGLATATLLVAAMVGPLAMHVPLVGGVNEPTGLSPAQLDLEAWRLEANYISQATTASTHESPVATISNGHADSRRYPDNIVPGRKEVPVRPIDRALTAH